ncbi:MAG: peptidoglycan glycosyltransferase FtsW, partial [Paracoccaceae bacterium]
RQAAFGLVAPTLMVLVSMLTPVRVRRWAVIGFGIALVAVLLLPVLGTDLGKGAVRWYIIGGRTLQPSEFLKPMFVVTSAWLLAASQDAGGPPGRVLSLSLCVIIASALVLQPDFGQAALIIFGWGVMFFVGGAPILLILGIVGTVLGAGVFAYSSSEHFARRIDGFLDVDVDPTTQIGYATTAIQEGGFFGVGLGEGRVKWSLADAHTDFVIAVAAEEYGLIAVLVIICLYGTVVMRSLARLMRERDPFIRLAGTGIAVTFGVQAFINIGVAVRLLPAKGMTLPFISYGGSSLLAWGLAMGMLLAFTRTRPQGEIEDILRSRGRGT